MTKAEFFLHLGNRLKDLCSVHNTNLTRLAYDADMVPSHLEEVAAGRSDLTVWQLLSLARAFNVPITTLFPPDYEEVG